MSSYLRLDAYYALLLSGFFRYKMRKHIVMPIEVQDICMQYIFVIEKFITCMLIGDRGVGKSGLLMTYTNGYFPPEFIPTYVEPTMKTVTYNQKCKIELSIMEGAADQWEWDYMSGNEHINNAMRINLYKFCDVVLILYSVVSETHLVKSLYENVTKKWIPELTQHIPNVPFLLVGTKIDLRSKSLDSLQVDDGLRLANEIGALCYLECSALTLDGVSNVFDHVIGAALKILPTQRMKKKRKTCQVL
eukprot:245205_1